MKNVIKIPFVENYATRKEWESAAQKIFIKEISKLPDKEIENLFSIITTPIERHNMLMRTAAIHRLDRGISYAEILKELWLSPQTISVIKRAVKDKKYLSYNERGKTERQPRPKGSISLGREPNPHYGKRKRSSKFGTMYIR